MPNEASVPYASYAQLVRMLLPLTGKVSFYDERGNALWISDGLEEPELRMHVEIVLNRCASQDDTPADYSAGEQGQPTYVFPIRNHDAAVVGAMAVVFRDLPANTSYRRLDTVERLLAPLLEILSHGWAPRQEVHIPVLEPHADRPQPPGIGDSIDGPTPLPALLRRTLALATHRLQCAFGAFVVTEKSFTLTHRASPDESDLAMNAAIDSVRAPMMKLMQLRHEALLVNGVSGRGQSAPYKFLVLPLRPTTNRLAALLMLFRSKQDRDFTSADVEELMQIVARLSAPVLAQLAPEAPATSAPTVIGAKPAPKAAKALDSRPSQTVEATATILASPSAATRAKSAAVVMQTPPLPIASASPRAMFGAPVPLVITADATPTMDERIRAALRDGRFDLYAQRISPLRDARRPARFEVLVRMVDADRLRAPASFFEAAEASALMPELDRWVIRQLLSTLRAHAPLVRSGGWEFCINIAAQSLITDRFSEFIVAEVCKSAIPAGLLVFEISECDALEHQHALEFLGARLRDVGCRIALDNCRAGLTTFGPLHKWPVSCVKIDGSLIGKLQSHARSESVVRAVTQLASSMGIETVAERVESADLCEKLLEIGIDYAQGFHFGQPQPLAAVFHS